MVSKILPCPSVYLCCCALLKLLIYYFNHSCQSHHKKNRTKRYEDYRNQLKLTRKSEEHRNRRFQQLAEAQKLLEQNCISESPAKSISQIEKFSLNEEEELKVERAFQREKVYEKRHDHVTIKKHEILNPSNYTSKAPVGQIDTSPLLPRGGTGDVHSQERIAGGAYSSSPKLKYHESANR